mmetsp:Transcript_17771/g.25097  ORF Transcript_17771/g.25097 Transcript_17771/m.25097 type:complete len:111 (-) Transcript_17771:2471-2803(-)
MHVNKYQNAHNELRRASQYITYELSSEHTRVSRLTRSITSKEATIVSALSVIKANSMMRDNFENVAKFLLKRAPTSREMQEGLRISAITTGTGKGDGKSNATKGKTGVEL